MTESNADRVGRAITVLRDGLFPYVHREMQAVFGGRWDTEAARTLQERAVLRGANPDVAGGAQIDFQAIVTLLLSHWDDVFRKNLGPFERNLVHELNATRNRWAHQEPFSTDDAYRALDSATRLLAACGAADEAAELEREKQELLRLRFEETARRQKQRATAAPVEGQPAAGLSPWRSVITPHRDVMSGSYVVAEFAADLSTVHRGEGSVEYLDPTEFFRRTFITEGLRGLLRNALLRLTGTGGEPIMDLQTNFGGGKTHSMLALYHMASGKPAAALPGLEPVLREAGVDQPPEAARAVIVGTALSPVQPRLKPDGTEVRTLWGELAWQLGGRGGYEVIAESDRRGTSPGSALLAEVLQLCSPCIVLIDEWVAYARVLYGNDGLPGGTFDDNTLNFAQQLTEAAKQAPQAFVVVSIPASNIEVGGEGGQMALTHLKNTIIRTAQPWRPASAEEGFEIVRRRLFDPIADPKDFAQRDATAKAFAEMYRRQPADFPERTREGGYEERIKAAYPIHPDLFDRLYGDWSTLERFQRTRGVLRLMAEAVHTLWEREEPGALILPASLPLDDPQVQSRLTSFLEDPWVPVIERDVDGPNSTPREVDRANPNLGRYSACRRVARTIFLGAAPTLRTGHRGIADRDIKLGCVQPGESAATFGDALRRLTDEATHLYVDQGRYWFDTQPSVARTARERAASLDLADVYAEMRSRLKAEERRERRGDFSAVQACPGSHAEVPDEPEARLVILGPEFPHASNVEASAARAAAAEFLDRRGTAPRHNRNALVFLAPDRTGLARLEQSVRSFKAWKSIEDEAGTLNLDAFQSGQAKSKREEAEQAIASQIQDAWVWLLFPSQELRHQNGTVTVDPAVQWIQVRLQGGDPLPVRAARRMIGDGLLVVNLGGGNLRLELDRVPLWRGDHVHVRQLWEDFPRYLYLPRLKDSEVLLLAVRDGAAKMLWQLEGFAVAEAFDEKAGRYIGLQAGPAARDGLQIDGSTLVVRPEVAQRQLDAEQAAAARRLAERPPLAAGGEEQLGPRTTDEQEKPARVARQLRRFHGSYVLNELTVESSAGRAAQEVIRHLTSLVDARVQVRLEIDADAPGGFPTTSSGSSRKTQMRSVSARPTSRRSEGRRPFP